MQPSAPSPALHFSAVGAEAAHGAAMPTIELLVGIECDAAFEIRTVALNVDVRIAAQRRKYEAAERERLMELFGDDSQRERSLRNLQWVRESLNVPRFTGSTQIRVPVPCAYDFDVVASRYLVALESGEIPVDVRFSGTVFFCGEDGGLQTAMIPPESEVSLSIAVATWRQAVDAAFPESAWIRMRRDTLNRLQAYRSRRGHVDWDQFFDELLAKAEER